MYLKCYIWIEDLISQYYITNEIGGNKLRARNPINY